MTEPTVRPATVADAAVVGLLLHDFNVEFGDPTPPPEALAARITHLLDIDTSVLVGSTAADGSGDLHGLVVLRFRPALWTTALECYLAELYVVPPRRRRGLGRALLAAAIEHARDRGADYMDLGTSESDTGARALYESFGFDNRDRPGGPMNLYYEREL